MKGEEWYGNFWKGRGKGQTGTEWSGEEWLGNFWIGVERYRRGEEWMRKEWTCLDRKGKVAC